MAHWRQRYGADIIELNYDHFINDLRPWRLRYFQRSGLRWDPQFLGARAQAQSVKTASVWQVREPLYLALARGVRAITRSSWPHCAPTSPICPPTEGPLEPVAMTAVRSRHVVPIFATPFGMAVVPEAETFNPAGRRSC